MVSTISNQNISQQSSDCNPFECDISVTLVTPAGSCEFFHDAFEEDQLEGFIIDCELMGWPVWFLSDGIIVFVTGGRK